MRYRTYAYRHADAVLSTSRRLKREIQRVLSRLELELPPPYGPNGDRPHRQIQLAFQEHGWAAEVLVSPRTTRRHYFDLYKDRVAIEIELSNRQLLYRDYIRFHLAETDGRIDVGVLLLFDEEARYVHPCGMRADLPRLEDVVDDLGSLHHLIGVPIWVLALS